MNTGKHVVLEHLTLPDRGLRFWTTNTENNTHGHNGELWYKEILFTDSEEAAIICARQGSPTATMQELEDYWKAEIEKRDKVYEESVAEETNNELKQLLIDYLSNEYSEDECINQAENATIVPIEPNRYLITYDNGVTEDLVIHTKPFFKAYETTSD